MALSIARAMKRRRSVTSIGVRKKRHLDELKSLDPFDVICQRASSLPKEWLVSEDTNLRLFIVLHIDQSSLEPTKISKSVLVKKDLTWVLFIHGKEANGSPVLSSIPKILTPEYFMELMDIVYKSNVCNGNADEVYVKMCQEKKGKFCSIKNETIAYLHEGYPYFDSRDECIYSTIRHRSCHLLVTDESRQCSTCSNYRPTMRSMYSRFKKIAPQLDSTPNSKANIRHFRTPQREKYIKSLRQAVKTYKAQVKRLNSKLEQDVAKRNVHIDEALDNDLQSVVNGYQTEIDKMANTDFRKIFWNQQTQLAKKSNPTGRRYHPLFIRWCLNIMMVSPLSYDIVRNSGIMILPSRRTLLDYTHWMESKSGFQVEVFQQLMSDIKVDALNEAQRHVALLFDEMRIREGIVFKNDGTVVGFVNVGDIDNLLKSLEMTCKENGSKDGEIVADHMFTLMVHGICMNLSFPLASFPTKNLTSAELHNIVWGAVRRLFEMDIHVICFVSDGASVNRKFYMDHYNEDCVKDGVLYKTRNLFEPERYVYFICDVPHLIKTIRNAWSHSSYTGTRLLTLNGKYILWKHLLDLYQICHADSGLYLGKIKYEHVFLTPFSRMNVRLAAQVLSKSVADAFMTTRLLTEAPVSIEQDTTETEVFCRTFNKFFDCMNSRHLQESKQKRNEDLAAYSSSDDERLKWLQHDFLDYLRNWEAQVSRMTDLSKAEQNKMLLPKETLDGLKITVNSFVEMVPFLLKLDGAIFIFSEKFCQDNLEEFFGKQRARGRRSDNPTVEQFIHNSSAISIGKSLAYGGSSNIRKRKMQIDIKDLSAPLPKRRRAPKGRVLNFDL